MDSREVSDEPMIDNIFPPKKITLGALIYPDNIEIQWQTYGAKNQIFLGSLRRNPRETNTS